NTTKVDSAKHRELPGGEDLLAGEATMKRWITRVRVAALTASTPESLQTYARLFVHFSVIFLVCVAPRIANAQNTVTVSGTVVDASGAVVPAAEVKLVKVDTGAVRTATSDGAGSY